MVDRVPAIQGAVAVAYMGGPRAALDGDRGITVPAPTDLWLDAVVTYASDDPAPARECGATGALAVPDVAPGLADELTEGPWLACAAGSFAASGWDVSAALDVAQNVVVLQVSTQ